MIRAFVIATSWAATALGAIDAATTNAAATNIFRIVMTS
jgi:hypothetical protein